MAKPAETSFLVLHIEKLAVGVCALVLLIMAMVYLPGSSTSVAVAGREVPAKEVDDTLLRQAMRIEQEADKRAGPLPVLPNYIEQAKLLEDPPFSWMAPPMGLLPPPALVPETGGPRIPREKITLAAIQKAMVKPMFPAVKIVPEYRETRPAQALAAHIVAGFPYEQQLAAWDDVVKSAPSITSKVLILAVETEVEESTPDGTETVKHLVKTGGIRMIDPNTKKLIPVPQISDYKTYVDGSNFEEIQLEIGAFESGRWEEYVCKQDYWQILWPNRAWGSWLVNLPGYPLIDKFENIDPNTIRSTPGRYAPGGQSTPRMTTGIGPSRMGTGFGPSRMGTGLMARPPGPGAARTTPRAPTPGYTPRPPMAGPGGSPTGGEYDPNRPELVIPTVPEIPTWETQKAIGDLLLWFHQDSGLDTSRIYRYRVRMKLLNPLLGRVRDVAQPADAVPAGLWTQWSDWSDKVTVPRENEMYLTGAQPGADGTVSVTVYTRTQGQRVKHEFTGLRIGDTIGAKDVVVWVKDLLKNEPVQRKVDFTTGATLVGIVWKRDLNPNGLGVRKSTTPQITYADSEGSLHTRMKDLPGDGRRIKNLDLEVLEAVPVDILTPGATRPPGMGGALGPARSPRPTPRPRAPGMLR